MGRLGLIDERDLMAVGLLLRWQRKLFSTQQLPVWQREMAQIGRAVLARFFSLY
jgi:hypothetical protein